MNNIRAWIKDYPCLREHFEASGGVYTDAAAEELLKFFELTRETDEPIAMVNKNIDLLWHKFIEFTELYADFCIRNYGNLIHHRPRTSNSAVPVVAIRNFYSVYIKCFGNLADEWRRHVPHEIAAYGMRQTNYIPEAVRWSGWPGRRLGLLRVTVDMPTDRAS